MGGSSFLDTNVIVYAFDRRDPSKQQRARSVLGDAEGRLVVSTQVLGELYVALTRKFSVGIEPDAASAIVDELCRLAVVHIDAALVRSAISTSQTAQISFWDAQIVESAVASGCDRVLTEDLAHGSVIRGVRIENPFDGLGT